MLVRVLSIAFLSVVTAFPVTAQAVAVSSSQMQTAVLPEHISVSFENISLPDAIWIIARRSGTNITFNRRTLPTKLVSYRADGVAPAVVLAAVLKGTGLRAVPGENGVLKLVNTAPSAQGIIAGKVTDGKTGRGISGANVSVGNDARGVTTGEDGSYRLTGVAAGTHTITVRLVGYAKQTRSITVGEGATATADFKLEPSANVLDQVIVTGTVVQTELRAVPNAITVITAKQIEERGITKIDQLFRGDIPGLFASNFGTGALLDEVTMFSRGTTSLNGTDPQTGTFVGFTNPIKTYIDGVEIADPKYLSQIDPKSIERVEILTGPQASTVYGSNAINGVMQIFTKRGSSTRPQLNLALLSGWVENNFSTARTPQHDYTAQLNGIESRVSYSAGGSWNYMGPWTPAKQIARVGGFGGARLELPTPLGRVTGDVTLRSIHTQSVQRGSQSQTQTAFRETGWHSPAAASNSLSQPTTRSLVGQTLGFTVSYVPTSWWSHELGLGSDAVDVETRITAPGYTFVNASSADTMLSLSYSRTNRRSLRYTTTAELPVSAIAKATVTLGADAWQTLLSSTSVTSRSLTGSLIGTTNVLRQPNHNTGGFLQTQLGVGDRLFLTYGLRAEWNPGYGSEAQPNYAPRYGIALTQELGSMTAKVRGSYGRSTRPPALRLKAPQTIADYWGPSWSSFSAFYLPYYGNIFDAQLPNPNLEPEHQQGGEGGVELYFGTLGSLVVTRYNQTVDGLIASPVVDSVRTLVPCNAFSPGCGQNSIDVDGYGYWRQSQNLNLGGIRNQGWELQGSVVLGPITTRGTYSWTKSRSLGITPRYRGLFSASSYPQFQRGATFQFLPEHTWAAGATYARGSSTLGLNIMGAGRVTNVNDDFYFKRISGSVRLQQNRANVSNQFAYINFNPGYALADLTASQRFNSRIEGLLQVQNLGNHYTNDYWASYASLGRQTKLGFRLRTN